MAAGGRARGQGRCRTPRGRVAEDDRRASRLSRRAGGEGAAGRRSDPDRLRRRRPHVGGRDARLRDGRGDEGLA